MAMTLGDALTEALQRLGLQVVPVAEHTTDEDCRPFLVGEEATEVQTCAVCWTAFGDPCVFCERRGFHLFDCPVVARRPMS